MKKLVLILIILCGILLNCDNLFAAPSGDYQNGDVRYEIQDANYDSGSNTVTLKGWALIYHQDHGITDNAYPKYTLRVTNKNDINFVKEYPSKHNDVKYSAKDAASMKVDLTCTLFTNFTKPECIDVLAGGKYKGLSGQAGVNQMVNDAQSTNWYYRNVGFEFVIPLSELSGSSDMTCNPNTKKMEYRMEILVDTGPEKVKSNNISIYKNLVKNNKVGSNLILENLPTSVKVIATEGRVRSLTGASPIPYNNIEYIPNTGSPYLFKSNEIYTVQDYYSAPLAQYAIGKGITDMLPYRLGYYGLYVKKTGSKNVIPGSLADLVYYAPATWVVPNSGNGLYTIISIPSENCEPIDEDYKQLTCHPNPSPVNFGPKTSTKGTIFRNTACSIDGTEDTKITLPSYPRTLKAGTGFAYPASLTSHIVAKSTVIPFPQQYWNNRLANADTVVKNATDNLNSLETEMAGLPAIIANLESRVSNLYDIYEKASAAEDALPSTATEKQKFDAAQATDTAYQNWDNANDSLGDANTRLNITLPRLISDAESTLVAANTNHKTVDDEYKAAQDLYASDILVCQNWNIASYYNPNPTIVADIEGNDYGNSSIRLESTSNSCSSNGALESTCNLTYELPDTYIDKYTGDLISYPSKAYYPGGRNFYTDLRGEAGTIYNLNLEMANISQIFKWRVTYTCDYSVYNEFPSQDQSLYMYRPISLTNPFPGRSPGSNWLSYQDYDFTKKNNKSVYDTSNIIYEVTLTPERLKSIKQYNQDNSYLDYWLTEDGKNMFVNKTFKYLFETPTSIK